MARTTNATFPAAATTDVMRRPIKMSFSPSMFEQAPPEGQPCEECGETITRAGYTLWCPNGCFEDDIRNYLSFDYR